MAPAAGQGRSRRQWLATWLALVLLAPHTAAVWVPGAADDPQAPPVEVPVAAAAAAAVPAPQQQVRTRAAGLGGRTVRPEQLAEEVKPATTFVRPPRPPSSDDMVARAATASPPVSWECTLPPPPGTGSLAAATPRALASARAAQASSVRSRLEGQGLQVTATYGAMVSVRATAEQMLAPLVAAEFVSCAPSLMRSRQAGAFQQGTKALGAEPFRLANPSLDGRGLKIGVISFGYYADCGQLCSGSVTPASCSGCFTSGCASVGNATVLLDAQPGSIDEGRAMAELICSVAPGAEILYHTGFEGIPQIAQAVTQLADAGCKIIVDDIGALLESWFSPSIIDQAIDEVVKEKGVHYFSSAGNDAGNSWEATASWGEGPGYVQASLLTATFSASAPRTQYHRFKEGSSSSAFFLALNFAASTAGRIMVLQWDEAWIGYTGGLRGPESDIEWLLCDRDDFTGNCVSFATDNLAAGIPAEAFLEEDTFTPTARTFFMAIRLKSSTRANPNSIRLKWLYWALSGPARISVAPGQGAANDLASATCFGHPNWPAAIGTGAARYARTPPYGVSPAVAQSFSSWGGLDIRLDASGNRLPAPLQTFKPDVIGPDDTDTSFFIEGYDWEPNGLFNFPGTSAAAPHVAALVALLLQQNPTLTPAAVKQLLRDTASDMGSVAGYDIQTGWGYVNGTKLLLSSTPNPSPTPSPAPSPAPSPGPSPAPSPAPSPNPSPAPSPAPSPPPASSPERAGVCQARGDYNKTCDDRNPCTVNDRCRWDGRCLGDPMDCGPSSSCLANFCDRATGQCRQARRADGMGCLSGSRCMANGRCSNGVCQGQPRNIGQACDDGDRCTEGDTCRADGTCAGTPKSCTCATSSSQGSAAALQASGAAAAAAADDSEVAQETRLPGESAAAAAARGRRTARRRRRRRQQQQQQQSPPPSSPPQQPQQTGTCVPATGACSGC